jgi:hypothetical protein
VTLWSASASTRYFRTEILTNPEGVTTAEPQSAVVTARIAILECGLVLGWSQGSGVFRECPYLS